MKRRTRRRPRNQEFSKIKRDVEEMRLAVTIGSLMQLTLVPLRDGRLRNMEMGRTLGNRRWKLATKDSWNIEAIAFQLTSLTIIDTLPLFGLNDTNFLRQHVMDPANGFRVDDTPVVFWCMDLVVGKGTKKPKKDQSHFQCAIS